jgi:hypothetical protein
MYAKAIYRTIMTMSSFYVENFCLWVKTAVWDAPRRIYLDIDLEYQNLSRVSSRESSSE